MQPIRYNVRSKALVDLANDLKSKSLILSPHFQRKLVWRDVHKVDFIKTILLGFPFPEIFTARGQIDVDRMVSTSCVVDGQQRLNSIQEYLNNNFQVDGKRYSDLTKDEKEKFLKYEIAIIDLDLDEGDERVIEIFKRLNRTFYSLSQIEKISTEFASSQLMLLAKLICGEFKVSTGADDEFEIISSNIDPDYPNTNPNIDRGFVDWANSKNLSEVFNFILNSNIFTGYELSRQIPLMYVLNILCTFSSGIYGRNDLVAANLEKWVNEFPQRDTLLDRFIKSTQIYNRLGFEESSIWKSKSNSFSLIVALDEADQKSIILDQATIKTKLVEFELNPNPEYLQAAKDSVNNKKERLLRHTTILSLISRND